MTDDFLDSLDHLNDGRRVTDFDFNDPATRPRLQLWLDLTISKINREENLTKHDFLKLKELLRIIQQKEAYKVPYGRGERKPNLVRDEKLVCWYRVTLEMQLGMKATEAKKATAERFLISEKLVESYCTRHRKGIERMIEKFDYDEVSYSYIEHLSFYKRGEERLLKDFLAKYYI